MQLVRFVLEQLNIIGVRHGVPPLETLELKLVWSCLTI